MACARSFVLIACTVGLVGCRSPEPAPGLLRIGTSGDYAPFSERLEGEGGLRGFDIDVARAFAQDAGYEIEWVPFRWVSLARDFAQARFDVAMSGVTVRVDRSVLGRFSVPVVSSGAVVLYDTRRFSVDGVATLADLDRGDVRIAVNRGGHLEKVARAHLARARLETRADNGAVREALVAGEVDAIVTDTLEAPHWRKGLPHVEAFGPLTRDRKAYWVSPAKPELARRLDDWLLEREADGTLATLRRDWFGSAETPAPAAAALALVAATEERLALMAWVAESKRVAGRAVEDAAREERVLEAALQGVARAAARRGVSPPDERRVRRFYRAQIEAAKAIQRATLAAPPSRPASAEDLLDPLRPALLRIGDRMASLIVVLGERDVSRPVLRALRESLSRYPIPDSVSAALVDAFSQLRSGVVEAEHQDRASANAP
ncbi:MAG: transporter substrate-binding domain-containing protein [Myxococcota bacterium]|jgi:cyclohexadienyl dehydratase|nr:transporter substrate-binding domain-containing protein [Myxococcota bacterium]